jgi:molybdopterin converting factor small subunit
MPVLHLKYIAHVAVITGKFKETIETKSDTIGGLLSELDRKYPGFRDLFVSEKGILNLRTMIYLRRMGATTIKVLDTNIKLKDGDILTFW